MNTISDRPTVVGSLRLSACVLIVCGAWAPMFASAQAEAKKEVTPSPATTDPVADPQVPPVSLKWQGGEYWGEVNLAYRHLPAQDLILLTGTYTTKAGSTGSISLSASNKSPRHYQGEWTGGENLKGRLSLRVLDDGYTLRGSWTTDAGSKIPTGRPEFSDLEWVQADVELDESIPSGKVPAKVSSDVSPPLISDRLFCVSEVHPGAAKKTDTDGLELVWLEIDPRCETVTSVKPGDAVTLTLDDLENFVVVDSSEEYSPDATHIGDAIPVERVLPGGHAGGELVGIRLGLSVAPQVAATLRLQSARDGGSWKKITHVVKLKHARAEDLVKSLTVAFPGGKCSADAAKNAVMLRWAVRDSLGELAKVELAIQKLDVPSKPEVPSSTSKPKVASGRALPGTAAARKLLAQLQAAEAAATEVAAKIRKIQGSGTIEPNQAQLTRHREELQKLLGNSFQLKLQLEELQMQELKSRLEGIERQISQRKDLRQRIVERRMTELIEGRATTWDPAAAIPAEPDKPDEQEHASNSDDFIGRHTPGPQDDSVVVDLYCGKIDLTQNSKYGKLVQSLNAMTGVVTNFRESAVNAGDKIVAAIVRDPSQRARREYQQDPRGMSHVKRAIDAALKEADVTFRWVEGAAAIPSNSKGSPPVMIEPGTTAFRWTGTTGVVISMEGKKFEIGSPQASFGIARDRTHVRQVDMFVTYPPLLKDVQLAARLEVYPSDAKTAEFLESHPISIEITENDIRQAWDKQGVITAYFLPDTPPTDPGSLPYGSLKTLLGPNRYAIQEADRQGTVLAVLRVAKTLDPVATSPAAGGGKTEAPRGAALDDGFEPDPP